MLPPQHQLNVSKVALRYEASVQQAQLHVRCYCDSNNTLLLSNNRSRLDRYRGDMLEICLFPEAVIVSPVCHSGRFKAG